MPELPEVETVRSDLARLACGDEVVEVKVNENRVFRDDPSGGRDLVQMEGQFVSAVMRWGKYLILLVSPDQTYRPVQQFGRSIIPSVDWSDRAVTAVLLHLGMSGQILLLGDAVEDPRHLHLTIGLSSGTRIGFADTRTFGRVLVSSGIGAGPLNEIQHLGADPIQDPSGADLAFDRTSGSITLIKAQLLDQSRICGVGNMYADEILIRAKVHPRTPGTNLSNRDISALKCSVYRVFEEAISLRGSSLKDMAYKDVSGQPGMFQERHLAYARAGRPCLICGDSIVKERFQNRYSHFCPNCQKLGPCD